MLKTKKKDILGRTTRVDLPGLGFFGIAAKVDTGAYYCSLHCHHLEERMVKGKKALCFMLLDPSHPEYVDKVITFKKFSRRTIKNSFGVTERRYIIITPVRILGRRIRTRVTLSNRGSMKFPMLLGRKVLLNKFVVDVSVGARL
ncbi:MAG: peptidase [Bacteroidia bacterium]|jgi:hypothetical protein|nr:peptidase [Bacteroidia bacterium]